MNAPVKNTRKLKSVSEPTNGGADIIAAAAPYSVRVTIEGAADMLMHRWNAEEIEARKLAPKNSKAKKTDNPETMVYRNEAGIICLPGEYLRMAIVHAARFQQDPRSPRKSAMDLFKAAFVVTTPLAPLGVKKWDYEDKRRVVVQRNGINRTRPAMRAGWRATFDVTVLLPEYVDRNTLRETIETAGRLIGVGDFRPTFGRFGIVGFN